MEQPNDRDPTLKDGVPKLPFTYHTTTRKIIPFSELCHCGDEVWIELDGQIYRLRRTKQGKLVLTK